jgi:hypothetical protein
MARIPTIRRYVIEIKDSEGAVVFSAVARWSFKGKRRALAQIERLAPLPHVTVYTGREVVEAPSSPIRSPDQWLQTNLEAASFATTRPASKKPRRRDRG